jgi:hypothetical protein
MFIISNTDTGMAVGVDPSECTVIARLDDLKKAEHWPIIKLYRHFKEALKDFKKMQLKTVDGWRITNY